MSQTTSTTAIRRKKNINRGRRVFVIGAGMSSECGAPLTRDILTPKFMQYGHKRSKDVVLPFLSSAAAKKNRFDPETLWTELDESIRKKIRVGRYDYRQLRIIRDALFSLINEEIGAVHRRFVDSLDWCGVRLSEGFLSPPELLRTYIVNPRSWLESVVQNAQNADFPSPSEREFLLCLIPTDGKKDTKSACIQRLTEFLSKEYEPMRAKTLANSLSRVLFTRSPASSRLKIRETLYNHFNRLTLKLARVLTLEPYPRLIINLVLWRKYLLVNHSEELRDLVGWFDTYFSLVQKLRPGDTVITTNYDLFLDVSLRLTSPWRQYGILTGTSLMQIERGRVVNVHGTTSDIADSLIRQFDADSSDDFFNNYMKMQFNKTQSPSKWLWFLKLHGSLSWGICHSCQQVFSGDAESFSQIRAEVLKHRTYNKGYETHVLCCANPLLSQLMLPPTSMKDYALKPLTAIWRAAEQRISNSDSLVFLGYSLPETDTKMIELIKKAQFHRKRELWTKRSVWCVSPSAIRIEARYKELFRAVTLFPGRASEFIESKL